MVPCKLTLSEIDALLASDDPIPATLVTSWIGSDSRELQARAFYVLSEQQQRAPDLPREQLVTFFLSFLQDSFLEDAHAPSSFRLSRYDAAEYLKEWFLTLWNH